jgi:hypothetical protein
VQQVSVVVAAATAAILDGTLLFPGERPADRPASPSLGAALVPGGGTVAVRGAF